MTVSAAIFSGLAETCGACLRWAVRLVLVAVLGMGAVVLVAADRSIGLPAPMVAQLETRLSAALPAPIAAARFGAVRVALRDGAVPVLIVEDLRLDAAGGTALAVADRVEAVLSRQALAAGQAAPVALRAEGLALLATRDAGGRVRLAAGGAAPAVIDAPDPAAALDRLAALLAEPPLDRLREVGLRDVALRVEDAVRERAFSTSGGALALQVGVAGDLTIEVDAGRFAPGPDGAPPGGSAGRVRGRIDMGADGARTAELTVRGLVPAATAGVAGVTPLADLMARVDAPVSMTLSGRLDGRGALAGLAGEIAVGAGRVRLPGLAAPVAIDTARAAVTLGPLGDVVRIDDLHLATDRVRLSGRASLRADPGGPAGPVVMQAALHDLGVTLPERYEAPVTLDALWIEARYDRGGAVLEVPAFTALRDGTKVTGRGRLAQGAGDAPPRVAVDLALAEVAPETLVELWPAGVIEGTRDWLRDNVEAGRFTGVTAALRLGGGQERAVGLSFAFEDAVVRAAPGLPPIMGGRGVGGIDGTVLTVAVEAGQVHADAGRPVDLTGGLVRLPDIRERNGTLEVRLAAATDATGALSLLTAPAFSNRGPGSAAAPILGPGEAEGDVTLQARMAIPLFRSTRLQDVDFAVAGEVRDFATSALLPGRAVEAALLTVAAGPQDVRIAGPARVAGAPVEVGYTRVIAPDAPVPGASRITARGALGAGALAAAGIALPAEVTLSGAGTWRAEVDLRPGAAPAFAAEANLAGAGLSVPALGLRKAPGAAGRITAEGRLGPDGRIAPIEVRLPGATARAAIPLGPGGALGGPVTLSQLRLGGWLDARARIDPPTRRLTLTGGRLDLRALPPMGAGGGTGGLSRIDVALDRVDLTDTIALTGVTGRLDGGLSGRLSAQVNGAAPLDLRLVRQDGGRALHATASDAGAVMRAAGAYGNLHGGTLDLRLVPAGTGLWRGQARIADTTLRDGPVVAQILSGLSVVGALEQAQGAGIRFGDLRADFRLTRDAAVIDAASAAGPAIGLSLDGAVDFARRRMDLQGVVSPIFFLNRAGSFMTRRGEGLIGVSYTVTGPFDAPRVVVNPLSVLTPGFLREVFRGDRARMPERPE